MHSVTLTRRALAGILGALGLLLLLAPVGATQDARVGGQVSVAEMRGIINPTMASYVDRVIGDAESDGASLVVLAIDTPGGADADMRAITQRILRSRVPVAVYVSPPGARAGSAGVFITYAAHIAAMAPSTNIGSAHPVLIGGDGAAAQPDDTMMEKITNDAVALIRSLAETRGRNADWAEEAVRESANLPASDALRMNVVDVLAADVPDLLRQVDGRTVTLATGDVRLTTRGAQTEAEAMNAIERFFHVISDPTIAYLLLSLGGLALIYELANPGAIFPGVVGGIMLLLALYSLGTLPINIAGVGLILFAFVLFFADLLVAGSGVLTVGAIVSFVLGSLLLATSPGNQDYLRVSAPAIVAMTLALGGFFTWVAAAVIRVQGRPAYTGREALIGASGLAKTDVGSSGTVLVAGELWRASAVDPAAPISEGTRIRVLSVEGLSLIVYPE
ncbi:MAG: nodulation protein NfeD [Chloroflexi bacterium]|nr:nodulation protein NfeD [Chloroflexota bacterium]